MDLVARRAALNLLLVVAVAQCQFVEAASAVGQNVEAELELLLFVGVLEVEVLGDDQVAHAPIQPRERQLDVEAGLVLVPRLLIIDLIYLL